MKEVKTRFTESEKETVVSFWKQCGSFQETSKRFGVACSSVRNWAVELGQYAPTTREEREKRNKEIAALYDGVVSAEEVARQMNLSPIMVSRVWRANGLDGMTESSKQRRKGGLAHGWKTADGNDGFGYVEKHAPQFEYVSGYTGSDSTIKVKCKKCGSTIEVSCVTLRMGKGNCRCPECDALERAKREEQLKAEQEKRREEQEAERRAREQKRLEAHEAKKRTVACPVCGKLFETYEQRRVCCSAECSKKRLNRKKDTRLNASNTIDKDITLERLYRRDHGRCYLCGRQCDWDDYEVVDGNVICGDDYPSVEHVKPLSKGGLHAWGNVKLACRGCNTRKSSRIIETTEATEQLRLFA